MLKIRKSEVRLVKLVKRGAQNPIITLRLLSVRGENIWSDRNYLMTLEDLSFSNFFYSPTL